jgi:hypothetical protein
VNHLVEVGLEPLQNYVQDSLDGIDELLEIGVGLTGGIQRRAVRPASEIQWIVLTGQLQPPLRDGVLWRDSQLAEHHEDLRTVPGRPHPCGGAARLQHRPHRTLHLPQQMGDQMRDRPAL